MNDQTLALGIERMKVILSKVMHESDLPGQEGVSPEVTTLRVMLIAVAELLEEQGSHPVKELLTAAVGCNAGSERPAPPGEMGNFLVTLCTLYRRAMDPAAVEPQ